MPCFDLKPEVVIEMADEKEKEKPEIKTEGEPSQDDSTKAPGKIIIKFNLDCFEQSLESYLSPPLTPHHPISFNHTLLYATLTSNFKKAFNLAHVNRPANQ